MASKNKTEKKMTYKQFAQANPEIVETAKARFAVASNKGGQAHNAADHLGEWMLIYNAATLDTKVGVGVIGDIVNESGDKFELWLPTIPIEQLHELGLPMAIKLDKRGRAFIPSSDELSVDAATYFTEWLDDNGSRVGSVDLSEWAIEREAKRAANKRTRNGDSDA